MTIPSNIIFRLAAAALLFGAAPLSAQQHTSGKSDQALTAAIAIPAARRAALDWLRLLDKRDYAAAYNATTPKFQTTTTPSLFGGGMDADRGKFQPFGARKIITQEFYHDPSGAGSGDYVMLKFHTDVVDDGRVSELMTLERMASGKWGVISYYLSLGW